MTDSTGSNAVQTSGGCACGTVRYAISGAPLFRAFCHCKTCQAYNGAEHADIVVMRSGDVTLVGESHIDFKYKQSPPVIRRGRCVQCDGVAIERIHLPFSPKLIILPVKTLDSTTNAPAPAFHMFYHRRGQDAEDMLPKHSSYLRSQSAFILAVFRGHLGRQPDT